MKEGRQFEKGGEPAKLPHEFLGILPDATMQEIKKAYRMLSMKYHPDNQETGDPEKFRAAHEAYLKMLDSVESESRSRHKEKEGKQEQQPATRKKSPRGLYSRGPHRESPQVVERYRNIEKGAEGAGQIIDRKA